MSAVAAVGPVLGIAFISFAGGILYLRRKMGPDRHLKELDRENENKPPGRVDRFFNKMLGKKKQAKYKKEEVRGAPAPAPPSSEYMDDLEYLRMSTRGDTHQLRTMSRPASPNIRDSTFSIDIGDQSRIYDPGFPAHPMPATTTPTPRMPQSPELAATPTFKRETARASMPPTYDELYSASMYL